MPSCRVPVCLTLLLASAVAWAAPAPRASTPPTVSSSALAKLGYAPAVAKRIACMTPSLARAIVQQKSRPLLLYRGVDIEPNRFDPRFVSTDPPNKLCFSSDAEFAIGYAIGYPDQRLRRGERHGVLLEAQIPTLLLEDPRAELVHKVDQQRMPDLAPFLKRFGVIELRRLRFTRDGDVDDKAAVRSVKWSAIPPPRAAR